MNEVTKAPHPDEWSWRFGLSRRTPRLFAVLERLAAEGVIDQFWTPTGCLYVRLPDSTPERPLVDIIERTLEAENCLGFI